MSSDPYPRPDAPGNDMRLPQAVIDQAEAVATNENEDADSSHPGRDNSKLEASKSEASRPTTPNAADAARTFITQEPPIEHVPPVAYGSQLGQVDFSQDDIDTKAKVASRKHALTKQYKQELIMHRGRPYKHRYQPKISEIV